MSTKEHSKLKYLLFFLALGIGIYIILKSYHQGNDINVYLYASEQLSRGSNIYANNIYNEYRYSPLFALFLRPLSILPYEWARVIWALIATIAALRIGLIFKHIIQHKRKLSNALLVKWSLFSLLFSAGFFNNNLILGQITVLILWLTIEGLYQVLVLSKNSYGAALIALGINIKIMPIFALFYLFFKWKWKAVFISIVFLISSLFLPALFIGSQYNNELLHQWKDQINPTEERFIFEQDNGSHALSALLPAYFYAFEKQSDKKPKGWERTILPISYDNLLLILQAARVLLLLSFLFLLYYSHQQNSNAPIYYYWEISYLMLISFLIFPHQLKYAFFYFVPVGSYLILFILISSKKVTSWSLKIATVLASFLLFFLAIMGRDFIGNTLINLIDYYCLVGIIAVVFLLLLLIFTPKKLLQFFPK